MDKTTSLKYSIIQQINHCWMNKHIELRADGIWIVYEDGNERRIADKNIDFLKGLYAGVKLEILEHHEETEGMFLED